MPLQTNDIRVLALLTGLEPKFLGYTDDKLLAMVHHECIHLYLQGDFRAFYDNLPSDIALRFMSDRRTLDWMLRNKCHFLVGCGTPTLAERLERGVDADIWYDDGRLVDEQLGDMIDATQDAMRQAAKLLREHGLDY